MDNKDDIKQRYQGHVTVFQISFTEMLQIEISSIIIYQAVTYYPNFRYELSEACNIYFYKCVNN